MQTILVVDDDRPTVEMLHLILKQYTVVDASDGESALHQLAAEKPDLVLMDLMMPTMDGALLGPKIRNRSRVPIIVLSGRAAQSDVVPALEYADDFISKPFDLDDLEARIEAVLRRSKHIPVSIEVDPHVGALSISAAHGARFKGRPIQVTPAEHRLLAALVDHQGEAVTHDELAQQMFGVVDESTPHAVDQHVMRLRRRLARTPNAPAIVNVYGKGFSIVLEE